MSEWENLPNSKHIDWVLQSLGGNLDLWNATMDSAWRKSIVAAWNDVHTKERTAARDAVLGTAWDAASGVLAALIAYDNCDEYLSTPHKKLLTWSKLDPHPAVVLLLPYVYAKTMS